MARWLVLIGAVLIVVGVVAHFAPWAFNWFGKLPGDINHQRENTRVFVPITSMIVLSVVLTLIVNLFNR